MNIKNYIGQHKDNIFHAQLRLRCSKLNSHLFALHVADSPACLCGFNNEDSEHFLLHCPLYIDIRQRMFRTLNTLMDNQHLNMNTLLYGNDSYVFEINCKVFQAVHLE